MKYISLTWTLALKFSIRKKKRMRDCRIVMAHDYTYSAIVYCILYSVYIILIYTLAKTRKICGVLYVDMYILYSFPFLTVIQSISYTSI